jgi:hypothetical protein
MLTISKQCRQDDRIPCNQYAVSILEKLDEDNYFLREVMFSHEATFYVSEKVNKHNVHFWVSEHPHATVEHIRDSSRVAKVTVTSSNYMQYAMFLQ